MRVLILLFILVFLSSADPSDVCRFASRFSGEDLVHDRKIQDDFLHQVAYWEGHFHQDGIGINMKSGLTMVGHKLNYTTGGLGYGLFNISAASKECLHVILLMKTLLHDPRASLFVNHMHPEMAYETALEILTKKIASYEKFNKQFPGGFFPWYFVSDEGITGPSWGWADPYITPSLDNGELIWAIYPLIKVLRDHGHFDLANRYESQLNLMKINAKKIFYLGGGKVSAVTIVGNVTVPPEKNSYLPLVGAGLIDDPYEGELFSWFLDLYGPWENETEREQIWVYKRAKLESVDYQAPLGNITVQRGFWYSAHEQWKILLMPYLNIPICKRIFTNCERARTVHSSVNKIPGLYASVYDVGKVDWINFKYVSDAGIQQLAFEPVKNRAVITPYGSFPTFIIDLGVGLAWYHNVLLGPRMQGPYGSTESINVDGTAIAALTTWDSKITSLTAMLGGVWEIVGEVMKEEGTYSRFEEVMTREYSAKFPVLKGEDYQFGLPTAKIPTDMLGYFNCSANSNS